MVLKNCDVAAQVTLYETFLPDLSRDYEPMLSGEDHHVRVLRDNETVLLENFSDMKAVELDGLMDEYDLFEPQPEPEIGHDFPNDPGSLNDE